MSILPGVYFCILVLLWSLTSCVHWGTAMLMSFILLAGACTVQILGWRVWHKGLDKRGELGEFTKNLAPFHGYGAFGWMLLVMMALTAFSLIPLPLGLLDILSPASAEWYREAWQLEGVDRSWGYLTAAWGRSAFALWGLVGSWALYVISLRCMTVRTHVQFGGHVFAIAGVLLLGMLGLKYLGHPLSLGGSGETAGYHIGFPVNSNHVAGVFSFLSIMALGHFLSKRHRDVTARKGLWLLLYVLFGTAVVLLKSRGALFSWGCGQIFVILYAVAINRQFSWKTGVAMLAAVGGIIGVVLFVAASTFGEIHQELSDTQLKFQAEENFSIEYSEPAKPGTMSKTQMYGDFVHMGGDWGRAGTGRSAFMEVYPQYQGFSFAKNFRHAENEYWEILLEYGWFWGAICLMLGAIGVCLFLRTYWGAKQESSLMTGLMAGVIALLLQNIFDFSLRYWTTGMLFWFACGALEARRHRWMYGRVDHDTQALTKLHKVEWIAGNAIALISLVTMLCVTAGAVEGHRESGLRALNRAVATQDIQEPEIQELVDDNLKARAGNSFVRYVVAQAYVRSGIRDKEHREVLWSEAEKWYRSALKMAPRSGDIAIHLAKICAARQNWECASEYFVKAAENDPRMTSMAMQEMSVLPVEYLTVSTNRTAFLALNQALINQGRYEDALKLIENWRSNDLVTATSMICSLYQRLGMMEGCDLAMAELENLPMSIGLFELRWNEMVRQKRYDALFSMLEQNERLLQNEPVYWEKRLNASVFYGEQKGDEWYRNQVPVLLMKYRKVVGASQRWQFYGDYYEAEYALRLGQYSRAVRCAKRALSVRPSHKGAAAALEKAQKSSKLK